MKSGALSRNVTPETPSPDRQGVPEPYNDAATPFLFESLYGKTPTATIVQRSCNAPGKSGDAQTNAPLGGDVLPTRLMHCRLICDTKNSGIVALTSSSRCTEVGSVISNSSFFHVILSPSCFPLSTATSS